VYQNWYYVMMNPIQQILVELVFVLVLCVSTQLRFVYFLIGRFVKLVAFLVVAFVLLGFDVLPQLKQQQQQ
jgi:hypothetical protein